MMTYEKTFEVLQAFYEECVSYWEKQDEALAKVLAVGDVVNITINPFSPSGEKLNEFAKAEFIRNLEI